jgi:hypothetical protein
MTLTEIILAAFYEIKNTIIKIMKSFLFVMYLTS